MPDGPCAQTNAQFIWQCLGFVCVVIESLNDAVMFVNTNVPPCRSNYTNRCAIPCKIPIFTGLQSLIRKLSSLIWLHIVYIECTLKGISRWRRRQFDSVVPKRHATSLCYCCAFGAQQTVTEHQLHAIGSVYMHVSNLEHILHYTPSSLTSFCYLWLA